MAADARPGAPLQWPDADAALLDDEAPVLAVAVAEQQPDGDGCRGALQGRALAVGVVNRPTTLFVLVFTSLFVFTFPFISPIYLIILQ